ncbi:AN1-type zinc finger domain-containing protein [Methanospirillum sp.]|uniref:AN1-type zinc finger domain-containing protein n=1 Tax=Methanospirillum sp. TaxID=45200 RepID=UPI002B5EB264|nr:AN1-type zinc finger domain-containing protein [Methanospirillum sp.]HOL42032.1 AN1-type zinc finger domain-containing protein [Methanospirillum sp.]HPP78803.1 AN1-type zinc finger domain-containing protein [Methanospirillum sp.]
MNCEICGEEVSGGSAFTCNYCGGVFCPQHRLPFNHACKNLAGWKKSGMAGKKGIGPGGRIRTSVKVPFYQKKEVLIGGAVLIAFLILVWVLFLSH